MSPECSASGGAPLAGSNYCSFARVSKCNYCSLCTPEEGGKVAAGPRRGPPEVQRHVSTPPPHLKSFHSGMFGLFLQANEHNSTNKPADQSQTWRGNQETTRGVCVRGVGAIQNTRLIAPCALGKYQTRGAGRQGGVGGRAEGCHHFSLTFLEKSILTQS